MKMAMCASIECGERGQRIWGTDGQTEFLSETRFVGGIERMGEWVND